LQDYYAAKIMALCIESDSALYQAGVIDCCRENHVTFTITADQDSAIKKAIEGVPEGGSGAHSMTEMA
jgi:hypothetical protein